MRNWTATAKFFAALALALGSWAQAAPAEASCSDSCGGYSEEDGCFCDSACTGYGDCCSDYTFCAVEATNNCGISSRAWRTATEVQTRPPPGAPLQRTSPDVGTAADGTTLTAWRWKGPPVYTGLRASRFRAGAWSSPFNLASGTNAPLIAVGAGGYGLASYGTSLSMFHPWSGWSALPAAPFPAGMTIDGRGVDGAGNLYLLYRSDALYVRRRSISSGSWDAPRTIGPNLRVASFAVNNAGDYAVIFTPSYALVVGRYAAAGGAAVVGRVTSTSDKEGRVGIADDQSVLSAWIENDNSVRSMRLVGSTFGPQITVGSAGSGTVSNLRLAVNGSGKAVAAWARQAAFNYDVVAATYDPSSGWSTPTVLATGVSETLAIVAPKLEVGIDACGAALLVHDDQMYKGRAYRYTPGSGWGPRHTFAGPALDVRVTVAANGAATAVWDDDQGRVWASRFE